MIKFVYIKESKKTGISELKEKVRTFLCSFFVYSIKKIVFVVVYINFLNNNRTIVFYLFMKPKDDI